LGFVLLFAPKSKWYKSSTKAVQKQGTLETVQQPQLSEIAVILCMDDLNLPFKQ
jgi:hypothetical protein